MKHDSRKIIQILNSLRAVKPRDAFRIALRDRIFSELGANTVINRSDLRHLEQGGDQSFVNSIFPQPLTINFLLNKKMLTSLFLILSLLTGSVGTTYAAQSSLPGDTLYPVKIASEKARVVIAINNENEVKLHGQFAGRRLSEIDSLTNNSTVDLGLIKIAVENYKSELAKNREVITLTNAAQTAEIAKIVSENARNDRGVLNRLSVKVKEKKHKDYLHEAWEEVLEHEDFATLALLAATLNNAASTATSTPTATTTPAANTASTTATSTPPTQATSTPSVNYGAQMRVVNKIAEAAHKITEAERYILAKEIKGADTTAAKAQIVLAKNTLATAQSLADAGKFQEAFIKAKEAHNFAQLAKKLAEKNNDDDKDEREHNFYIAPYLNQPTASSTAATTTPQATILPINWDNYQEIRKEWREEIKNKKKEEKKENRKENNGNGHEDDD